TNSLASRCTAAEAFWQLDLAGKPFSFFDCRDETPAKLGGTLQLSPNVSPTHLQSLPSGAEVWQSGGKLFLAGSAHAQNCHAYYAARTIPADFLARFNEISRQSQAYDQEKQHLRALKRQLLLILSFFTVLLLSSVLWVALYLSKQVTGPIQALAE